MSIDQNRRRFLRTGMIGLSALWSNVLISGCSTMYPSRSRELTEADTNGVRLPPGFRSRVVAESGNAPVPGSDYTWHDAPDGGACFPTGDGGWIYVSNSEIDESMGGVGALRFDADGELVDAYSILQGTSLNCAGGTTPWGTWLSCEEHDAGKVWETDPTGRQPATARSAMGIFKHEAVAFDPVGGVFYLTEDQPDGLLYRFRPEIAGQLGSGMLEAATVSDGRVSWQEIPDPSAATTPTREQLSGTAFDGGEGIVYHDGHVYFTTKGDNRVWSLNTITQVIEVIYDACNAESPILTGVDNITVDGDGKLYVAEDGGDMQVVVLTAGGRLFPVVQLEGHDESEVAGIAFDPSGTRLYFSSQRGFGGESEDGITFEITGPFLSL